MEQPQKYKTSDIVITLCYGACIAQFIFTLYYVNTYCQPINKLHMALVGLSGACAILLCGIIRRSYKSFRSYWDKKEISKQVDDIVSKMKQGPS